VIFLGKKQEKVKRTSKAPRRNVSVLVAKWCHLCKDQKTGIKKSLFLSKRTKIIVMQDENHNWTKQGLKMKERLEKKGYDITGFPVWVGPKMEYIDDGARGPNLGRTFIKKSNEALKNKEKKKK
jgi:hypothetical protein